MTEVPRPAASPARPPRIAHVGIAVSALDAILPFYRDVLGMPEVPLDDADGARIAGLAAGESLVELLEAESGDSPIGKFVAKRGPGIHHICFAVDDLDGTLDRCRAAGVRLIDETPRLGAEGKRIAFLHPSATAGVLVELTEL
jgi:methylmalonyl-CoA/ethylmalonyl-CoA epimerase